MPSCAVSWCKNNSRTNNKSGGITFHLFPTNIETKKKWLAAIRRSRDDPHWQPSSTTVVCSAHFEESDLYITTNDLRRVKRKGFPKKDLVKPKSGTNDKGVSTILQHRLSSSRNVTKSKDVLLLLPSTSSVSENDFIKQEIESDEDGVFTTVSIISQCVSPSASSASDRNFPTPRNEAKLDDVLASTTAVFTHNKSSLRNAENDKDLLQSISTVFTHNLATSQFVVTGKGNIGSSSSSTHENLPKTNKDSSNNDTAIIKSSESELLKFEQENFDSPSEYHLKSKVKKQEEQLNSCRKKIRTLQQEVRRLKSRNAAMKDKFVALNSKQ